MSVTVKVLVCIGVATLIRSSQRQSRLCARSKLPNIQRNYKKGDTVKESNVKDVFDEVVVVRAEIDEAAPYHFWMHSLSPFLRKMF